MMRIQSRFLWALALGLVAVATTRAQVTTGTPPFSSISGGFDKINEANLNVNFSFPVIQKPGRGLPLSFALTYDSSVWYPAAGAWTPVADWGWQGATSLTTGYTTYRQTVDRCTYGMNYYFWSIFDTWVYHDANGTLHPFNITISTWNSQYPCGSGAPASGSGVSTDGQGYSIAVHADIYNGMVFVDSLYAVSGTRIIAPLNFPTGSGSLTDTNGNKISTDGNGWYDTLSATTPALSVSGSGTQSSPRIFTFTDSSGNPAHVTVNYTNHLVRTNFGCGTAEYGANGTTTANFVTRIDLPDGTYYGFSYETTPGYSSYWTGRLASIDLPTGGSIAYSYTGGSSGHINCADGSASGFTRTISPGGPWTYARTQISGSHWQTSITDPASTVTTVDFWGLYETKRVVGSLLTLDTCYNGNLTNCTTTTVTAPITRRTSTVTPAGISAAKRDEFYNSSGLPTEVDEFNYGSGTATRKTIITYAVYDRPASITIWDGAGTKRAETLIAYDCASPSQCTGFSSVTPTPVQWTNPTWARGDPTVIRRWVGGTSYLSTNLFLDTTGQLTQVKDPKNNSTNFSYAQENCSSSYQNAYLTKITNAAGQFAKQCFNLATGLATQKIDANGQPILLTYDSMTRPLTVTLPNSGGASWSYNLTADPPNVVTTTNIALGVNRVDTTTLDGMGRVTQSVLADPEGDDKVDTTYDSMGRPLSATNPYRGTSSSDLTVYSYDTLSRVTKVIPPDGTDTLNNFVTSYSGNCATSTDPAGKAQTSCFDALGRITSVTEDPSGLNYQTTYAYDALGNLTGVTQGSQTRSYTYDMLSRVTQAVTPEGGTVNFYYTTSGGALCSGDPNALCRRDAPKPNQTNPATRVLTTYAYDALNRLTSKSYDDGTATANYYYDETSYTLNGTAYTLTNTNGRLSHTSAAGGTAITLHSYDVAGRPNSYIQCTPYNCNVGGKTP